MFPFLNRLASFSDFPQHLGLICVSVLSGKATPCTAAPFFPCHPWLVDIRDGGEGTVKSTLGFVRRPRMEFWLCHLPDVGCFDTGRVPGSQLPEVHGVCMWVQSWGGGLLAWLSLSPAQCGVLFAGGLVCRALLSVMDDHNVDSFISLSSPQMGQYGGEWALRAP